MSSIADNAFRRRQRLRDLRAPAYSSGSLVVDLNELLHRHQLSLMQLDQADTPEERRAHSQFACDYAEKIGVARNELGAPAPLREASNDGEVRDECLKGRDGRGVCVTARLVLTPAGKLPYKVMVSRNGDECPGHAFGTIREAEAFIRRNMPAPAPRSTLYDREPRASGSA